ncbi:MAG: F0F1 ATP synthase subunit gamma [Alphaproteobacteria bacterium]|nr:F0F1 ATP synthase subunit gamma [Alphaproteobacteria bacterium]
MPSLRDLRDRIVSVKSTKKITSAMKMVAAAKLKKAQDQAEASQPYAQAMAGMLARVAGGITPGSGPKLLAGTGSDKRHLLVVVSSDRGLCGGFNGNLLRFVLKEIARLEAEGKTVKIVCAGRKARDLLKRTLASQIIDSFTGITGQKFTNYEDAEKVAQLVLSEFDSEKFDVCTLMYNEFHSVLTQRPKSQQLIPFAADISNDNEAEEASEGHKSPYDFEPEEAIILGQLLPKNIGVQIFGALLDSSAGEQAARMTAMDSATRNAGDKINDLSLQYNRARQAHITKELIEIISGAEAV